MRPLTGLGSLTCTGEKAGRDETPARMRIGRDHSQRVIQGLNCSSFSRRVATASASRRSGYLPTRTRNTFGPLEPGVLTNEGKPFDESRRAIASASPRDRSDATCTTNPSPFGSPVFTAFAVLGTAL